MQFTAYLCCHSFTLGSTKNQTQRLPFLPLRQYQQVQKMLLIMRLTVILVLAACFKVSAGGYAQQITLRAKDMPCESVFREITRQSGYQFFFNKRLIRNARKVSVELNAVPVEKAIEICLADQPFDFAIINTTVVIRKKDQQSAVSSEVAPAEIPPVTVRGKVTDEQGNVLPGATVRVKGSNSSTVANADGVFTIEANTGDRLEFSFVGFETREILITKEADLRITLKAVNAGLSEVVVVGYGTQKRGDLTGSIASVKGDEINAYPISNIAQSLSGRAAGVQVSQNSGAPGGSISVRIRGTNSIRGNNEPLYVIDGFPVSTSNPNFLNNGDIESVEILKDASATAIYGSRGANGVILITTKSGKGGKTSVEYGSSFSIQEITKKINMMDAHQYATYMNEIAADLNQAPRFDPSEADKFGKGFDWQDFVFRKALMQNHNLTVSGGNEKTQFSTSGSIFDQEGIIRNSGFKRYSLRNKLNHKINDRLELRSNIILSNVNTRNQNSSGGGRGTSLIAGALNSFPTVTPYNDDGTIRDLAQIYSWNPEVFNPAYYFETTNSIDKTNRVLTDVSLEYKPIRGMTIKISGGVESSDVRSDSYTNSQWRTGVNSAAVSRSNHTGYLNENLVTYNKKFNKHDITILGGFTYQDFRNTSVGASGRNFLSDNFNVYNLGAAGDPGIPSSSYSYSTILSGLGRIIYNYDDRFLATASFRADGSSVFSEGNKWGYFPSGSVAWRMSKEKFLSEVDWVSDLKLRVGYGVTGSQAISPYTTLNTLSSGTTGFDDGIIYNYFIPGSNLPGALKWETTKQSDFGIDLSLFNNRLRFTGDYYIKRTDDLLNPVPLSLSTGYVQTIKNIGSIKNSGLEFSVGWDIIYSKPFKWNINGNFGYNKNRVLSLFEGNDILGSGYNVTLLNEPINIIRVGQPLGAFFGYLQDGYDQDGLLKYVDVSGDGNINSQDKVIIGNPIPKYSYGFSTEVSYKNFVLNAFFQGIAGRDIFNLSSVNTTLDVVWGANLLEDVYYNTWGKSDNPKYPKPSNNNVVRVSDRFIENGSYLRMKNVQLAYNLSSNNPKIENIQLYIAGENLLTFTKYSWWDPEVNSQGGSSSINQGIDYHTYPNYKTVSFGIRVKF